jgi:hypothetical protein
MQERQSLCWVCFFEVEDQAVRNSVVCDVVFVAFAAVRLSIGLSSGLRSGCNYEQVGKCRDA